LLARKQSHITLPKAPVRNIAKSIGVDRMAADAVEDLKKATEEFIKKTATKAHKLAEHAKRETVTRDDIKMALE
jgi:histone H3/H4